MTPATHLDQLPASAESKVKASGEIPVVMLGWSLALFFVISYAICVAGYYVLPQLPVAHGALAIPLPGFQFGNWSRFFLGMTESFAWGWYIALVFGSIYNFLVARRAGQYLRGAKR